MTNTDTRTDGAAALPSNQAAGDLAVTGSAVVRGRGRPKGSKNKVTKEMQALARRLVRDRDYRRKFTEDWKKRKNIAPNIEQMMYHYAGGKPPDQVQLGTDGEQAPTAFVLVLNGQVLTPHDPSTPDGNSGSDQ